MKHRHVLLLAVCTGLMLSFTISVKGKQPFVIKGNPEQNMSLTQGDMERHDALWAGYSVPFMSKPYHEDVRINAFMDHDGPAGLTSDKLTAQNNLISFTYPFSNAYRSFSMNAPSNSHCNITYIDGHSFYAYELPDEPTGFNDTCAHYDTHSGYDFSLDTGKPVYPVAPGRFIPHADDNYGEVRHDIDGDNQIDYVTWYVHITPAILSEPDVTIYTQIGTVGAGNHLHLTVFKCKNGCASSSDKYYTDPFGWWSGEDPFTDLVVAPGKEGVASQWLWQDECPFNTLPFCDVPPDTSAQLKNALDYLYNEYITDGCRRIEDRNYYCPDRGITRGEAAIMVYRWLHPHPPPAPNQTIYSDISVDEYGDKFYGMLQLLNQDDVFVGFGTGEFRPNVPITRKDAITVIMRGILDDHQPPSDSERGGAFFEDTTDQWILAAKNLGIVQGYADNRFRPDRVATRADMALFLYRAISYKRNGYITTLVSGSQRNPLATMDDFGDANFRHHISLLQYNPAQQLSYNATLCFTAAMDANIPGVNVTQEGMPVCYLPGTQTYRGIQDIAPDHWARLHISGIYDAGITSGCNSTNYCPEDPIQRDHTIVFLLRAKYHFETGQPGLDYEPPEATSQIFSDVSISHPYVDWINEAYRLGIAHGFSDGTFRPGQAATRADWAVFLVRTMATIPEFNLVMEDLPYPLGVFEDVAALDLSDTEQFRASVFEELYWRGITTGATGCGTGLRYCPEDVVSRAEAAVFTARTFIREFQPVATDRLGDFCFSTASGYDLPRSTSSTGLDNVEDADIVCYHPAANIFKMYFNGSANGLDSEDIDAISITEDGEIWFSTTSNAVLPDIGTIEDEDIVRYENGGFALLLEGDDFTGLGSENIDAFDRWSSSMTYLSTGSGTNVGFAIEDEDIISLNLNTEEFEMFLDGSDLGLSDEDITSISVEANSPDNSTVYLTLGSSFCVLLEDGSELCGDEGDVLKFTGITGPNTSGSISVAFCFSGREYEGLEHEALDAIHVSQELLCQPPLPLPSPPDNEPPLPDYLLLSHPTALSFTALEGGYAPPFKTVDLVNGGTSNDLMFWSAQFDAPWLTFSETMGTTPAIVQASVDILPLNAGIYTETIAFTSPQTPDSFTSIQAVLEVAVPPASKPITLTTDSGHTTIQLLWNPTNDPTFAQFRLSRAISGTLAFTPLIMTTDTMYFDQDPALVPGETYCYQVDSIRVNGSIAMTSNVVCAKIHQLDLWVNNVIASPSEVVTVSVGIRNAHSLQIASSDIWLDYDHAVLQFLSVSSTPLTRNYVWIHSSPEPTENGLFRVKIGNLSNSPPILYDDGALFELSFQVVGVGGDASPLNLITYSDDNGGSAIYVPDNLFIPLPLVLTNGTFQVVEGGNYRRGDINGNGLVEVDDASLVQRICNSEFYATDEQIGASDVNTDGTVDSEDATLIAYYALHNTWPSPATTPLQTIRSDHIPIHITINDVGGLPGNKVSTTILATGLSNVAGGSIAVAYDTSLVAHVENVEATDFTEQFGLEFYDNRKGLLTISFVSDVPLSGDGIIATLSFVIRDGAIGGITAPLTLVDAQLNDLYGLDLENSVLQTPIYTTNGELTILNVPLLHVSSTNLYYEVSGAPATHGLIVSNSGTGTLRWIASEVADWVSLDDASGITPAILNITVQPEGLKGGVYESEVTITNADDLTQVKVIRVWLTVISHELYLSILLKE